MRFAADENFNGDILYDLRSKLLELDVVRVQDTEMYKSDDPALLEWAAQENRILLTHDIRTIPKFAFERVAAGLPMPGVIEVKRNIPIREAVDGLFLLIGAGVPEDFENQVRYVPL